MSKQPVEPSQPVVPAQPVPQNSTPIVPPMQPNVSGKPSCGYTLLIIILTVICTLIAEVVLIFALVSWGITHFWSSVKEGAGFTTSETTTVSNGGGTKTTGAVVLTADQKKMLAEFGIKPEDIPADLDVQKITCIQNAVGADRIQAIIDGKDTPGIGDIFKARSCF